MAFCNPINLFPVIMALLLTSMHALASTSLLPPASGGCTGELVAFSPCLPYISSQPNNVSSSPSKECCDVFSSAFETAIVDCLCYFARRPLLLGFPVNSTRLFSLSSMCPVMNTGSKANGSLESLCSGLPTLPPLQGLIGPDNSPPPMMNSQPDSFDTPSSDNTSPATQTTVPGSNDIRDMFPSAAKRINNPGDWLLPLAMIAFLVPTFVNLHSDIRH